MSKEEVTIVFGRLLRKGNPSVRGLIEKGEALLREGDLDGAERCYSAALAENPRSVAAVYNIGCILRRRGDHGEAEKWARKALDIDPDYKPAAYLLGDSLFGQERYGEALHTLLRAEPPKEEHQVRAQIGLLHEKSGDWEKAEASFRSVLEGVSSSYDTRYAAVALHDKGAFSADLHHALARVLQRQNKREEAWLHYHLARRVDPLIELDPVYREILTEDDIENHPYFDRPKREMPSRDAEFVERLKYVLQLTDYDDLRDAIREMDLTSCTEDIGHLIQAGQHDGHMIAAARLRLVGDIANGENGRPLCEAMKIDCWLRILEIAEENHQGAMTESDGLGLASRIRVDDATALPFLALVRRYIRLEVETSRSLVIIARAAFAKAADPLTRSYGSFLAGEYYYALGKDSEAEAELSSACQSFETAGFAEHATTAFEKLARIQQRLGNHDKCNETCVRFVQMARKIGDPLLQIDALGLLSQYQAMSGSHEQALKSATEGNDLIGRYGAPSHVREGMEMLLHYLRAETGSLQDSAQTTDQSGGSLRKMMEEAEELLATDHPSAARQVLEAARQRALADSRFSELVEILFMAAAAERELGHLPDARHLLTEALGRGEPLSRIVDLVRILSELANVCQEEGDTPKAIEYAERALVQARLRKRTDSEAMCHQLLAYLLKGVDDHRAVEHFGRFLALSRSQDEEPKEKNLYQTGSAAFKAGDYSAAIEAFEAIAAEGGPDTTESIGARGNLALAYYATGDVERALSGLTDTAERLQAMGAFSEAEDLLARRLRMTFEAGLDIEVASADLVRAVKQVQSTGLKRGSLTTASASLADFDRLHEAEELAVEGLIIAQSPDWRDDHDCMSLQMTLGRVCRGTGRYEDSVEHYQKALQLALYLKDEPTEGTIRGWKAVAHRYLNQLDTAVAEYKAAIKIAQRYGSEFDEAQHRINLVTTLMNLGHREEALDNAVAALRLALSTGSQRLVDRIITSIFGTFNANELPEEIRPYLDDFEQRAAESGDDVVRSLALAHQAKRLFAAGKIEEADGIFETIMSIHRRRGDQYNLGCTYLNRAQLLRSCGETKRARADIYEASAIADAIGQKALKLDCDELVLKMAIEEGESGSVEAALRCVFPSWLESRSALRDDADRIRFADRVAPLTELCARFFIEKGLAERAFAMTEWGRAQALSDLVAAAATGAVSEPSAENIVPERKPAGQQRASEPSAGRPETVPVRVPADATAARSLLRSLNRPAVLLSLSWIEDQLVGIAIRAEGKAEVYRSSISRDWIAAFLAEYRLDMYDYHGMGAMTWLKATQEFLGPFAACIQRDDLVIFLLEEDLQSLPVAGFRMPDGTYLVEWATVVFAPSLTVLTQIGDRRATRSRKSLDAGVAAVGIAFPDEALAIQNAIGGIALTGNHLPKDQVREFISGRSIIHFACHGHFDPEMPAYSALDLHSPSSHFLGHLLTVRDLAGWRLDADLAVLSACETGLGEVAATEFLGFSRNLLGASVDSVIATLWPVRRQATRDFMVQFYHELKREIAEAGMVTAADALRTIQRQLMAEREYYEWAAFKLIGWPIVAVQ